MTSPELHLTPLPDGRQLRWADCGDPDGLPVFFFHGGPGSHRPIVPGQSEIAASLAVRLLCVERPGFGGSPRHPQRTLVGWADDVAALADAIGLRCFAVIGHSAGGPHALVCAARLGDRVTRAVAVGCGVPWNLAELSRHMDWQRRALRFLTLRMPWSLWLVYRSLPDPKRQPEKLVRKMLAGLPEPDRELLADEELFRLAVDHTITGVTDGFDGMVDELIVLARPWGFDLESITVPTAIWCGTVDSAAPLAHSEFLAEKIPGAELHPIPGEGHLCIIPHWREIVDSARWEAPR